MPPRGSERGKGKAVGPRHLHTGHRRRNPVVEDRRPTNGGERKTRCLPTDAVTARVGSVDWSQAPWAYVRCDRPVRVTGPRALLDALFADSTLTFRSDVRRVSSDVKEQGRNPVLGVRHPRMPMWDLGCWLSSGLGGARFVVCRAPGRNAEVQGEKSVRGDFR
jgi:hypothetical protein